MRKKKAKKRVLLPDPKFNDQLVTRFVNNLMWDGKKSVAFKVFYDALDIVEAKKQDEEKSALEIWKDALSNVMPQVEVRSRRVGGATFQIPQQIRPDRKVSIAIKWMIRLVDPPTAALTTMEFSKAFLVRIFDNVRSSQTISTILLPDN